MAGAATNGPVGDGCPKGSGGPKGSKARTLSLQPVLELLNEYCQKKGVQPEFQFTETRQAVGRKTSSTWQCTLILPGLGELVGTGATKISAQESATNTVVERLIASGAVKPVVLKGKGKEPEPKGPSWVLQGAVPDAPADGKGKKGKSKGKDGKGKTAAQPEKPGRRIDAEMQLLLNFMRSGDAKKALDLVKSKLSDAEGAMSVKQLSSLVTAVAMQSNADDLLAFFDALVFMRIVSFPDRASRSYFMRFARWAVRELLAEAEASAQQAARVIPQSLERTGICVSLLTIGQGGNQTELQLTPPSGRLPERSAFQRGDWCFVTVPHTGTPELSPSPGSSSMTLQCEIASVTQTPQPAIVARMTGTTAADVQTLIGNTCRVDRAANHVTFGRQMNALRKLCDEPGDLLWLSQAIMAAEEEGGCGNAEWFCEEAPKACQLPKASQALSQANDSQLAALKAALSRRLTLIQGPPGAGKTSTSVLLMRLWASAGRKPILATAESNIAVDNLVSGCADSGLNVIRIGRQEASRPELSCYNLFEKVRESGGAGGDKNNWKAEREILAKADVVCSTCSGAAHHALDGLQFMSILIDEAAQATEIATLVPLTHMHADGCAVLVGDHRQLPATVACLEADVEGLGTSLFERLGALGVPPLLLDIQYRMHPALAAYSSAHFYNGRLRSGVCGPKRPGIQGILWPAPWAPIVFVPIESQECPEGSSYTNNAEADAIAELLAGVTQFRDVSPGQIGIITPYAAQARLLRMRLGLQGRAEAGVATPEVSSVDGFQGREKELILVSTVRANPEGRLGFVGDPRRLNVTLTRAKRGLVVCGHFNTLAHDKQGWQPWLIWAQERGLIAGCPATSEKSCERLKHLNEVSESELLHIGGEPSALAAQEAAAREASKLLIGESGAIGDKLSGLKRSAGDGANGGPPKRRESLLMRVAREAAAAQEAAEAAAKAAVT